MADVLVEDKTAEDFTEYMKKFTHLYASLSGIVKHHTPPLHPFIVDLGCGPGLLSLQILKDISNATIIGIDPLKKMLSLAQSNVGNPPVVSFQPLLGVSEHIPLKDACVDTIVSRFSLAYWKRPDMSFLEMYRVLKPGGKIVFEALNRDFPKWKLFCIKMGMVLKNAGHDVIRYHVDAYELAYTMDQVETFFTKTGFVILRKEGKKNEWKFVIVAQRP